MADRPQLKIEQVGSCVLQYFADQGIKIQGPFNLAGQAGSGRQFFRIAGGKRTWVLMKSPAVDKDFHRFKEYSRFFADLGLPTPEPFCVDESAGQVLQEDFGDIQLYHIKQSQKDWKKWYLKAIDALILFQNTASANKDACSTLANWQLDYKGLRWETEYFTDNFIVPHLNPLPDTQQALNQEFDFLASQVTQHSRMVIHRDFQSQNIMICQNRIGMVDFQGARMGSPLYDLASLLWDPYTELPVEFVHQAFDWYVKNSNLGHSHATAWNLFLETSLQRLMQACGAYCFLSQTKKLTRFAKHLGPGLARLRLVLECLQSKELAKLKTLLLDLI